MTDREDYVTCRGFGPAPLTWDEVLDRDLANLWPGGREEFDRVLRDVRAWSARPDAALWYGVNWAEARRA